MKLFVKKCLEKYAPRLRYAITSYKNKRLCSERFGVVQKSTREKLFGKNAVVVLSGPFIGMPYIDEIVWGPITPKWLGTYECELHPIINQIVSSAKHEIIIDVGAAEGYYAVGLAKLLPQSTVFTFDLDVRARQQQRRLARLNAVTNLIVGFLCDPRELQRRITTGSCLLICDIEGFEITLLDPTSVPALLGTDILVEVHSAQSMSVSDVRDVLKERFQDSHIIETIDSRHREVASFRAVLPPELTEAEFLNAVDEGRHGPQYWLWMRHRR